MTEGEGDDTGDVPLGNTAKPDKEIKPLSNLEVPIQDDSLFPKDSTSPNTTRPPKPSSKKQPRALKAKLFTWTLPPLGSVFERRKAGSHRMSGTG